MKKLSAGPGTVSGLLLRIGQLSFASASFGVLLSSAHYTDFIAFCYMTSILVAQILWSLGLACVDVFALKKKINVHRVGYVCFLVAGDWVIAILSISAACSSAAVNEFFSQNTYYCTPYKPFPCSRVQISIVLSFIALFLNAISFLVTFWICGSY